VSGSETVSFTDDDRGQGLQNGVEYTYRIVAVYPNGAESKASNEITSSLVSGAPIMRNVSVVDTDETNGEIFIAWQKPNLDTIPHALGPYQYIIYRATGTGGTNYEEIDRIFTTDLNDTTYFDRQINTHATGYIYRVELWNNDPTNEFLIGDPSYASSLYLSATPANRRVTLSLARNVPWINTRYDIFRWNDVTSTFDSIANTNQLSYIDLNLENEQEYRYLVRSTGEYMAEGMPKNLINYSQEQSVTPEDIQPPCPPLLNVESYCDDMYNLITWRVDDPECFGDIAGYKLYYRRTREGAFNLMETINDPNIFTYTHYNVMSGCYAISAFNTKDIEGEMSEIVCVDICDFYEIPNVFTPNGDGINDILIARTSSAVEKVDFKIYNRTGLLIFSTENPRIEWDGTYNGRVVSPGIYFYQCDVYENRITGLEVFHLSGFVYVITEQGATNERRD
jgi:gliding motility-associated-like protein